MSFIRFFSFCLFLFFFHNFLSDCDNSAVQKVKNTQIRVINNSEHSFTGVSLFSMPFENLMPNDTSEYKVLNYNSLKDDPLIYCISGKNNFGRYLEIPNKDVQQYTYVIDSLSNSIIYVSSQIDKQN